MLTRVARRLCRVVALGLALAPLCASSASTDILPLRSPCPKEIPADAKCYSGRDPEGAYYWIAVPANWNQTLVVHAHGGPDLGAPNTRRSHADLTRWAVIVRSGYAWAGSSYRRGGYGVTMAAEDIERLRRLFVRDIAHPRRTLLHGQSYGAGVAVKAAELYGSATTKPAPYDGVVLTSGIMAGGTDAYTFRLDLRVVYQYVCRNHPRADEPQYPLWMGLPRDATLTRAALAERIKTCTGLGLPATERTREQTARLHTILNVVKIPERTLLANMIWSTWMFQDLTQARLNGQNPFDNTHATYRGSLDDVALNAGVARYRADPGAVAKLAVDSKPSGRSGLPTVSLHAVQDPIAFVELESVFRDIVTSAGQDKRLVQVYTSESEHSYLSAPQYPALFSAMMRWIDEGDKPTPSSIAAWCKSHEPRHGDNGKETCHIIPDYQPGPLGSRNAVR